jgi:hypothetical protein
MIWMQHKHIPEIWLQANLLPLISRVLIEEEMGGVTYSAQYTTESKETLENIIRKTRQGSREGRVVWR